MFTLGQMNQLDGVPLPDERQGSLTVFGADNQYHFNFNSDSMDQMQIDQFVLPPSNHSLTSFGDGVPSNFVENGAITYQQEYPASSLQPPALGVAPITIASSRFKCAHCEKHYKNKGDLDKHIVSHGPTLFRCPVNVCHYHERGFHRKDHFIKHLSTHMLPPGWIDAAKAMQPKVLRGWTLGQTSTQSLPPNMGSGSPP